MGFNEIMLMIFCIVLIFIVKKIIKMFSVRKNLVEEVITIELRARKMLLILSLSLVGFGVVYAYTIKDIFSIIYVLIGISYAIISTDKLYIAKNGFCYDGKFVEFKSVKKWDKISDKFFEVVYSTDLKDQTLTIPLTKENSQEFSNIIKKNKQSKKIKK